MSFWAGWRIVKMEYSAGELICDLDDMRYGRKAFPMELPSDQYKRAIFLIYFNKLVDKLMETVDE